MPVFQTRLDYQRRNEIAKWNKNESLGKALSREGKGIAKGVARELLSIATLGLLYRPPGATRRRSGDRWRRDMNIDQIEIGFRYRRELGDLGTLAASIAEVGLLHPV